MMKKMDKVTVNETFAKVRLFEKTEESGLLRAEKARDDTQLDSVVVVSDKKGKDSKIT